MKMTWRFFHSCNDEGYACVDAKDDPNSPIDEEKLEQWLIDVTGRKAKAAPVQVWHSDTDH